MAWGEGRLDSLLTGGGGGAAMEAGSRVGRLSRFEWACLGIVVLAFLYRAFYVLNPNVIWDSAWYMILARSFGETGTFLLPWHDQPAYSGYWPPLFPIFASVFVKALGPSYASLIVASVTASLLLTVGVLLMTWDLYGRTRGFAAMALVAASPPFLLTDGQGMSESLLALAVALTVWAFLKSLRRPLWLVPAGAFALLAYLGKASLGLPLVGAAVVVLAGWRVWTRGWRNVLRSKPDLLAAAVAVALLAVFAATRTGKLGGLGLGIIIPVTAAIKDPNWAPIFLFKLLFAAGFLAFIALPLTLLVGAAWKNRRDERTGALWIATLLPVVAGAVFTTSFKITEGRSLVDFDNIRYLSPALVPFLWLLLPFWPADAFPTPHGPAQGDRLRRRHEGTFLAATVLMATLLFLNPLPATPSLERFVALLLLALVPLALALNARANQVEAVPRSVAGGATEYRYMTAKPAPVSWPLLALVALVSGLLGWYVSAWFIALGLGLAVALCARSPRAQVAAMALMLLAGTAPGYHTPTPWEDAVERAVEVAGPGGVVGVVGEPVFVAGVAPEGATLRHVNETNATVDVILYVRLAGTPTLPTEVGAYRRVEYWNSTFEPSPALAARLAIETNVLGEDYRFLGEPTIGLYVRNGSAAPSS